MFALGIRYITGYAVATDVSNREHAEWPPHPARVFMAMAAAHFETGEDADERAALKWLEEQGAPSMQASEADAREVVTYYVPPNDMQVPHNAAKLKPDAIREAMNVLPSNRFKKQPRSFPRVRPRDDTVFLLWPKAQADAKRRSALDSLCGKVTRIGHSSSLVQMWAEESPPEPNQEPFDLGERHLRTPSVGTLDYLTTVFNRDSIVDYADLQVRIVAAKGKAKTQLKQQLADRFGEREPVSLRPTISCWQAYGCIVAPADTLRLVSGAFDPHLLVLSIEEGPVIGLESTWRFLTALRDTILSKCDPTPEWLSGHKPDGSPSEQPHLALVPLAFIEHEHADGHLMGVAMAFPKEVLPRDRGRALRGLLYKDSGEPNEIKLLVGSLGTWQLYREVRPTPPVSLRTSTWTGPSLTWATVTPISLDRQPKADRAKNRQEWFVEVGEIVGDSCERQGLPRPIAVDIDKTSWFRGVPRAVAGNGSGFPMMPVKQGRPQRQQVHAWFRFAQPIEGPFLLGAGRYRGYGVCRPWKEGRP